MIGLFSAAATSLLASIAASRRNRKLLLAQLGSALPPEPHVLVSAIRGGAVFGLDPETVARIQLLPARLSMAKATVMPLLDKDSPAAVQETPLSVWQQTCNTLLDLIRRLKAEGQSSALDRFTDDDNASPSIERLLAAAALGGAPCVGPDGIVEIPGWLERRKVKRQQVNVDAQLVVGDARHAVIIRDLSPSGAGLERVDFPLDPGVSCRLVAGDETVDGVIIWCGEGRCGVKFAEPLDATSGLIQKLEASA
ncbi:MAG: PilZ domain-containing protein [Hyphomicrobiaceae bacterium]